MDSQTVEAHTPGARRGYDAFKKAVGRRRHVAIDTNGCLLIVNLTPDAPSERGASQAILDALHNRYQRLKHLSDDGSYDRTQLLDKTAFLDFVINVVRRIDNDPGFKVLPRRWRAERTFGWRQDGCVSCATTSSSPVHVGTLDNAEDLAIALGADRNLC